MNRHANFVRVMWAEVQQENPDASFGEISGKIAEIWWGMTCSEKKECECQSVHLHCECSLSDLNLTHSFSMWAWCSLRVLERLSAFRTFETSSFHHVSQSPPRHPILCSTCPSKFGIGCICTDVLVADTDLIRGCPLSLAPETLLMKRKCGH